MKSCKILGEEKLRIGRQQIYNIKDQPTPRSRGRPFPHLTYDCLFSRDSLRIKRIFVWSCSTVVPATHCMHSPINKCCGLWSCFSCLQTQDTQAKATQRWKAREEMSLCKREIYFHPSFSPYFPSGHFLWESRTSNKLCAHGSWREDRRYISETLSLASSWLREQEKKNWHR